MIPAVVDKSIGSALPIAQNGWQAQMMQQVQCFCLYRPGRNIHVLIKRHLAFPK